MSNNYKHAVIFGDCHFPFHDRETLNLSLKYVTKYKPDLVIQIGDLYDNFNYSRFYKSPDIVTPRKEMDLARKIAVEFWKQISLASPKARKIQLLGNHDSERLEKMSLTLAPALFHLVSDKITELMTFNGVETISSYRGHFGAIVQGEKVNFMHGCFSQTVAHAKHYQTNVVLGHLHRGEIIPFRQGNKDLWAMNVGYLGDYKAPVFKYTKTTLNSWTLGLGVIDKEGPKFLSKRALKRLL